VILKILFRIRREE